METNARELLPPFVDLLLDAVFVVDIQGQIVDVSAACESIFGYRPDELIGQKMIDFIAPEDRARTVEEARHVMAGRPRIGFENRYIRKDGRRVHIMWSARWSEKDQLRVGVARDITERKQAENRQAATYAVSEAAHHATDLAALFQEVHQIISNLVPVARFAVAICDPKTNELRFPFHLDVHGHPPAMQEALARRYCAEAIASGLPTLRPDEATMSPTEAARATNATEFWLTVPLITQKGAIGALILKSLAGTTYLDTDQELLYFVSAQVATAIEGTQLRAELLRSARYDDLTGMPNRRLFHERIEATLARCRRKQCRAAVLFVDLDNFKQVNDSFGHATGDLLLQEIAMRLVRNVRANDTVARLGGDEFAVLIEDVHAHDDALVVASNIRKAVSEPVSAEGFLLRERASIGIAFYPDHGADAGQLLKHADEAMYLEKRATARAPE
ncbi:MAG: diguanylate cyclase [Herminiimonas sp.]|nr:diguanylate cyclase [Herminiimonas sp.]